MLSDSRRHENEGRGLGVSHDDRGMDALRDGFAAFRTAGDHVEGAFRCARCGYGVALASALPRCPMCGGEDWEDEGASAAGRSGAPL